MIAAIVLAAGASSRMGRPKPLMPLDERTVLEHCIDCLRTGGVGEIVVVTGVPSVTMRAIIDAKEVREAVNPQPERGMLSSVVTGLAALSSAAERVFVLPADVPLVRARTISSLIEAGKAGSEVVYPVFRGQRGHPPLIDRGFLPASLPLSVPGGLATILASACTVAELPVVDEGVLLDMDDPAAYVRLLARLASAHAPTANECEAILESRSLPPGVIAHSRVVLWVALQLAWALARGAGFRFDMKLLYASALLHDLAKGEWNHDQAARRILEELGFPRVGAIVGQHIRLNLDDWPVLQEQHLLYLADKLVLGRRVVSLEERRHHARQRQEGNAEALAFVEARFADAYRLATEVERLTGTSLAALVGHGDASGA